jgi:hypothetical protein
VGPANSVRHLPQENRGRAVPETAARKQAADARLLPEADGGAQTATVQCPRARIQVQEISSFKREALGPICFSRQHRTPKAQKRPRVLK